MKGELMCVGAYARGAYRRRNTVVSNYIVFDMFVCLFVCLFVGPSSPSCFTKITKHKMFKKV